MISNRKADTILKALHQVCQIYAQRGFTVSTCLLDGEFESLRGPLSAQQITVNITSNNEHVPEIERYICTPKERTRCMYNTVPFTTIPPHLLAKMVYTSNFRLNSFRYEDGISDVLSP